MDREEEAKKPADDGEKAPNAREGASVGEITPKGEKPPEGKKDEGNPVTRLYDKIPITYKQADILVKVLIGAFVLFLIFIVLQSPFFKS